VLIGIKDFDFLSPTYRKIRNRQDLPFTPVMNRIKTMPLQANVLFRSESLPPHEPLSGHGGAVHFPEPG
jgi:hypothetical protein